MRRYFSVLSGIALCLALAASPVLAQSDNSSLVQRWPADELRQGTSKMLLVTNTHLIKLVAVGTPEFQSHQGTSDIFFVEQGAGTMLAGGTLEGAQAASPNPPGEMRGTAITGGQSYDLKPGAVINIPPSTPHALQKGLPRPDGGTAEGECRHASLGDRGDAADDPG